MITPEPTDTAPDASKPARGWVWHSTDESIAAGQISVLSVVETFCALGLYGWLAFHFEHQWWLLISAVAAPIILLRSPESKALGVKWLSRYWADKDQRAILSKKIELLIVILASYSTTWVASRWFHNSDEWSILIQAMILGMIASSTTFLCTRQFSPNPLNLC